MLYQLIYFLVYTSASSQNISQNYDSINEILFQKLPNTELNDSAYFDYFYGNNSEFDTENSTDNLDFSAIDPETVKRIYNSAKKKNLLVEREFEKTGLRQAWRDYEAYYPTTDIVKKAMELITQSVYSTRLRLADTRHIRKHYSQNFCYNVAIFYGALMQLRMRMDHVYATMSKLMYEAKFIWFLGLYERIVTMHVDVGDMVEKMFSMYSKYKRMLDGESVDLVFHPRMTLTKAPV